MSKKKPAYTNEIDFVPQELLHKKSIQERIEAIHSGKMVYNDNYIDKEEKDYNDKIEINIDNDVNISPQSKSISDIPKSNKKSDTSNVADIENVLSLLKSTMVESLNEYTKSINKINEKNKTLEEDIFEAELSIQVLKYTFKYTYVYDMPEVIIFVLKDNFSLSLESPVEFGLKFENKNYDKVTCIGKPLNLFYHNLNLLMFIKN